MVDIALPPWSFSMLEAFNNCPRSMMHKYILKEKGPETEQMRKGNEFDKHVENRLKHGTPLPDEYKQYDPFAASLSAMTGKGCKIYTQLKLGISRDFKNCGFFDKEVWGRGVLDVALMAYPTAIITDWKTGNNSEKKSYSNHGLQLKIFTLLVFKHFPRIDKVTAFNLWLKTNEIGTPYSFTRADEPQLWREVLTKVMEIEKAWKAYAWPERPGPLCSWCPVKACAHNRS